MRKRQVGNLLGLAVLAYLSRAPMHPYELSKTLRTHGDDRSIKFTHGSLYMVVQQLAKAGFVAEQGVDRDGARPERTVYAITDTGRAELQDWLRELVGTPQHEYPAFVSALSMVAALSPNEVVPLLRDRLTRLDEVRSETAAAIEKADGEGIPPLFLIEELYRLRLLDAERSFVEEFIAKITDPTDGWGPMWATAYGETFRDGS